MEETLIDVINRENEWSIVLFLLLFFFSVAIVNRWDSIIDSMRAAMRPSWPWIHLYGLVKRELGAREHWRDGEKIF